MKKIILGVVFAVAGIFASQAQEISFEKEIHDFGTFEQHGDGNYEFKFTNTAYFLITFIVFFFIKSF